jgi:uncharacterized protein YlxP (DUF503 family)
VGTGYVGILSLELHFPDSGSLKDKRRHVRSLKAQLQNRVGCAVAEVDHHETWQRATLTLSVVTREAAEADRLLDDAERYVRGRDHELLRCSRRAVSLDDEI